MINYTNDWRTVRTDLSAQFSQLTTADIESAEGNEEKLITRICERYGYERDRARRELNEFLSRHPEVDGPFDPNRSQFNREKQLVVQGGEAGPHVKQAGLHQIQTPAEAAAQVAKSEAAEAAKVAKVAPSRYPLTFVEQAEVNEVARRQAADEARKRNFPAPVVPPVKKTDK